MRLKVRFGNETGIRIPVNYQEYLTAAMYGLLNTSNKDYARFVHDEGHVVDGGRKRFKLFVFSRILGARSPRIEGEWAVFGPGELSWFISSPEQEFLYHCAAGLLAGGTVRLGSRTLPVLGVDALKAPDFCAGTLEGICLSPIIAAVRRTGDGSTRYLRPVDGHEFSEAVRSNLLEKLRAMGRPAPVGAPFRLEFNREYLERRRGGTQLINYKELKFVGAMAPFRATGDPSLLATGYDCGFGEKNAMGMGMVEERVKRDSGRIRERDGMM